jgi:hypothetical protein
LEDEASKRDENGAKDGKIQIVVCPPGGEMFATHQKAISLIQSP